MEPGFIDCELRDTKRKILGRTTREGELAMTAGRALLGPATFPVWSPTLHPREKRAWTRRGWVIVARAPR